MNKPYVTKINRPRQTIDGPPISVIASEAKQSPRRWSCLFAPPPRRGRLGGGETFWTWGIPPWLSKAAGIIFCIALGWAFTAIVLSF